MTPEEIASAIADVQAQLQALSDAIMAGTASAEEVANLDNLEKQLNDLNEKKSLIERTAALATKAAQSTTEAKAMAEKSAQRVNALPSPFVAEQSKSSRRELKAFQNADDAYKAGMFLRSIMGGTESIRSNAKQWCEAKGIDYKTLTSANEGSAGLFVTPEIEAAIIKTVNTYGVARKNADVKVMDKESRVVYKTSTGNTAYFATNQGQATVTDASWKPITLTAKKLTAQAKYEDYLSDDAIINIADEVAYELGIAIAYREDYACFMGDGSQTNGGIVGVTEQFKKLVVDAGGTWATDAHKIYAAGVVAATNNTWSSVTLADLTKVVAAVKKGAGGKFKWYVNDAFHGQIMLPLAYAGGGVTGAEITSGVGSLFLGYPVEFVDVMPEVTGANTIPVLFGDLSAAAMLGDRQGIQVKSESDFDTDTTKVKATERFDFVVHNIGNADSTSTNRVRGAMSCLAIKA